MSEQSVFGPILLLVGIVLVLFRAKLAALAADYYQRSPEKQERIYTWAAVLMGLVYLGLGYYAAYVGQVFGLVMIGGGALLALFAREQARTAVAWMASEAAQRRGALVAGSVSTGLGLLMTLYSALLAL